MDQLQVHSRNGTSEKFYEKNSPKMLNAPEGSNQVLFLRK